MNRDLNRHLDLYQDLYLHPDDCGLNQINNESRSTFTSLVTCASTLSMTYRTRNTVSFFLFHFRWSQGYDGDSAEFITNDTLCYKCGNNVKFVKEDGSERVYATDGNRCLAVHGINNVFAFADQQLSPVVHIMSYPSLETIQQLKGTL